MKKFNLKALIAGAVVAGSFGANAATTETVNIFGNIALNLNLVPTTVPAGTIADNAPGATADGLSTDGVDVSIGTMGEVSNSATGYTVTASSANDSALVGITLATDSLPYTFKYDGVAANLVGSSVTPVTVTDVLTTNDGSVPKTMTISWIADPALAAQDYSDSITFVIAQK